MKSKRRKKKASKDFDDDILFDYDIEIDLPNSDFKIEDYDLDDDFDLVSFDTEIEDLLFDYDLDIPDYDLDISDPIDAVDEAAQAADGAGDSES